jgi:putative PIN family toxin of toxin-antitoxin system
VPPKAVFDCMVYLQAAAREESPAAACLRLAENNLVQLFVSSDILDEIRDVLSRPKIRVRFSELTDETVTSFVERLRKTDELVESVPRRFAFSRDVDDEPYLNLAIEVQADYLVSRDNDLLDLIKSTTVDGIDFQKRSPFLRILNPVVFLREIEQKLQR